MAVKNIECQIARGQIGRYLSGDPFSAEALRQLEGHIGGCAVCKGHLAERKKALQAMLGGMPTHAAIEVDADPAPQKAAAPRPRLTAAQVAAAQAAIEAATPKVGPKKPTRDTQPAGKTTPDEKPKPIFTRPLIYAMALSGVLIAMSFLTHNGADLLGPKAAAALNGAMKTPAPSTISATTTVPDQTPGSNPTGSAPVTNPATTTPVSPAPTTPTDEKVEPTRSLAATSASTKPEVQTEREAAPTPITSPNETKPKVESAKQLPSPPPPASVVPIEADKVPAATKSRNRHHLRPLTVEVLSKPRHSAARRHHKATRQVTVRTAKPRKALKSRVRVYDLNGEPIS